MPRQRSQELWGALRGGLGGSEDQEAIVPAGTVASRPLRTFCLEQGEDAIEQFEQLQKWHLMA